MPPTFRRAAVALATAAVLLTLPATAFGQATRTWVSGVGDDANPCSRTAPCKTFAGAISKTASRGEISVLDPGGFGGVTITKPITIRGRGATASALVSGTNAIVVNAGANDRVSLVGLDIIGIGTGLNGVRVLNAGRVSIRDVEISGFIRAAVVVAPGSGGAPRVMINRSTFSENGIGVLAGPESNGATRIGLSIRNSDISDNHCGIVASSRGINTTAPTSACGTINTLNNLPVEVRAFRNTVSDHVHTGVYSRGAAAKITIGENEITGNDFAGLLRINSGLIPSAGGNVITDNGTSGVGPSSTIARE
jgi:hypothetical protein